MEYAEKKRLIIEMRASGKKIREIKEALGYKSDCQIIKVCKEAGIGSTWYEQRAETIVSMRQKHMSMREIAEKLGIKQHVVQSVCERYGVGGKMSERLEPYHDIDYGDCVCRYCGEMFHKKTNNQVYCCVDHRRKSIYLQHDIERRKRISFAMVDKDISLPRLYEIDGGVCYICGGQCDWSDFKLINGKRYASKNYPTIDHVVPLSKGGKHEWANIRLAHLSCNASKGNR